MVASCISRLLSDAESCTEWDSGDVFGFGQVCITKNLYRREWRGGGCEEHNDPLEVPDDRQRLILALVQKKVAEVLQDARFFAISVHSRARTPFNV